MGSMMSGMMPGGGGGGGSSSGGGGMGGGFPGMPQQNGTEQNMPSQNIMGMQVPDFMGNISKMSDVANANDEKNAQADEGAKPDNTAAMPSVGSPVLTQQSNQMASNLGNMNNGLNANAQANNAYGLSLFQPQQQQDNYGASLGPISLGSSPNSASINQNKYNQNQYGLGQSPLGNISLE